MPPRLFSLRVSVVPVSRNWVKIITFAFGFSFISFSIMTAASSIFGCSTSLERRFCREIFAALNSADLTRFCTALDFFWAACSVRELKYSFRPESVWVSRSSRAWEIFMAVAVRDIPIMALKSFAFVYLAPSLPWSFKRAILFAGPNKRFLLRSSSIFLS